MNSAQLIYRGKLRLSFDIPFLDCPLYFSLCFSLCSSLYSSARGLLVALFMALLVVLLGLYS